jgi:hypothetical protein
MDVCEEAAEKAVYTKSDDNTRAAPEPPSAGII